MESERFDAVTRRLSTAATRRGVLGVLAGVVGLGLGLGEVVAKPRHRVKAQQDDNDQGNDNDQGDTLKPDGLPCNKNAQCRSGYCAGATGRKATGTCQPCIGRGQPVPGGCGPETVELCCSRQCCRIGCSGIGLPDGTCL